ncbi:MAG TPA: NAD-dependent epimerase/dehydratase family protein [Gaiellaceae bacterium]|nr:NAD-dependent epimerase/dehydratase family protein [Gaiellaceae bacterium]
MRYLVTGAAGFIGSHLAAGLVRNGDTVVGVDSFSDYYARELKEQNLSPLAGDERFRLVESDARELDGGILEGIDGVFHLAAQAGVRGSWGNGFERYVHDNVLATQHIFELAAQGGVRVVFASSSSVYGNAEAHPTPESATLQPISPYGVTKAACESLAWAYADQFGLDVAALRFFTVYGPGQRPDMAFTRLARCLLEERPFTLFGDGTQTRDFTYVEDAVAATMATMRAAQAGSVYNVGGGERASMLEVIAAFEENAGHPLLLDLREGAAGDVQHTGADTTAIRRDTGWEPRTSLRDGIASQWASTA